MRRRGWLVAMVIVFVVSLMPARTALAFEEPTVTIDRPSPDETHAVKVTVPNIDSSGNGLYPFSCTVEGSGVTQITWDVSPSDARRLASREHGNRRHVPSH